MNAPLVAVLMLSLLGGHAQRPECACERVSDNERPHGANELVEIQEGTVGRVEGVVGDVNGERFPHVIVEAFRVRRADKGVSPYDLARRGKRAAACLTDKRGRFCLPALPDGKYVLRIGTHDPVGMQAVHISLRLERGRGRPRKGLEIELPPGT